VKIALAKAAAVLLAGLGAGFVLSGHDVISTKITFDREISRVIYNRCASCHHEGGSAFSLMTYADARPWAKAIKEEVLERRMPPFAAVKGFGDVDDSGALTQEELHLIADWVEGGSPEGEPTLLPKLPDFKDPAKATASPKAGAQTIVDGSLTLKEPATFVAARAASMTEGSSIQAVAEKPDGTIQPLIWIYDYKPKYDRTYYFRDPLSFPAGTKIETFPAGGGTLALLAKK
jgi:hypothetical protein